MDGHIPWLMDRLQVLFRDDSSSEDWQSSFEQCDPRSTFTTDLCDACYRGVTALRISGENVSVVSKEMVDVGKLMMFLHDRECFCQENSKTRFDFRLLDVIAASGSMTALRQCILFFQQHLPSIPPTAPTSTMNRDFKATSNVNQCRGLKSETKPAHLPAHLECNEGDNLGKKTVVSTQDLEPNNSIIPEFSVTRNRVLLSPNCGGGYGEREQFHNDHGVVFESGNLRLEHNRASLKNSSKFAGGYSSTQALKKSDYGSSCKLNSKEEYRSLSQKRQDGNESCCSAVDERTINIPSDRTSPICFRNLKPDPKALEAPTVDNASAHRESHRCQAPTYGDKECPLACCFPRSEVDCLRYHIDQTTLLSMSVQALYYNKENMMVCARALSASTMSELVRISGSLPVTGAFLYLYFLSLQDSECFSEVALDELFSLHQRTLPLEVSQLCQLAWTDHYLEDLFYRSRHTSFHIALCHRCELVQFPDRGLYGKTARVKFRRGYHDNAPLFKCIENGGCPCTDSMYKQTQLVMPETAAAASGNLSMVRALTKSWISAQAPANDKQQHFKKGEQYPRKSCRKSPKAVRRSGVNVYFSSQVEHYGESNVGFLLCHSLYGGSDDIVYYILENMGCWSLSGEEIMACLRMCLLMGRDDLFFLLSPRARDEIRLSRTSESGSPLMMAASSGRYLLVNLLLANGADPSLENYEGLTAIDLALGSAYTETHSDSEMIALRMLSVISDSTRHKSHIKSALRSRKLCVARYLMNQGVHTAYDDTNLRHRFWERHTYVAPEVPLIQWWLCDHIIGRCDDVLEFLLGQGLDVNTQDSSTEATPLHFAIQRIKNPDIVEMLLAYGAKTNTQDKHGLSPLFYTVEMNQMVNFGNLIKGGATVYNKDSLFRSALKHRQFQIILFLLHAGYFPTPANLEQLTQLGPRVPEPLQVLISSVRSQPPSLPVLCALSLREALGDGLNPYLDSACCPGVVKRFVHMEHLVERFFDVTNWNKMLSWDILMI